MLRERGAAERLIESFMIAANETVARHITYMEYPFIYRVHGEPNEEKINKMKDFYKEDIYGNTGQRISAERIAGT